MFAITMPRITTNFMAAFFVTRVLFVHTLYSFSFIFSAL
jgi:hypothetical protein